MAYSRELFWTIVRAFVLGLVIYGLAVFTRYAFPRDARHVHDYYEVRP